jgi:glycosyltransferase involved in cell wall biosynthesis
MPCLNEAETIAICIQKAQSFLANNNVIGEVVISDNGSTDDSVNIAKFARSQSSPSKRKGLRLRFDERNRIELKGRYVIMGDADDSYDFLSSNAIFRKTENGVRSGDG